MPDDTNRVRHFARHPEGREPVASLESSQGWQPLHKDREDVWRWDNDLVERERLVPYHGEDFAVLGEVCGSVQVVGVFDLVRRDAPVLGQVNVLAG